MEVRAKAKNIRMSPRKVRLVVDLVRGLAADKALDQLKFINKWAAKPVSKLINSAIANAYHNFEIEKDNLYIKEVMVDEGATIHRWMPRAHGRATPIRKRNSHINIVLAEIKESGAKKVKEKKIEAPIKLDGKPKEEDKQENKKDEKTPTSGDTERHGDIEKGKEVIDPRGEGHGKHTKVEGKSHKGFTDKVFRRKSG